MTTVQINLPDKLAQDAERAGLLSSAALESLLRERLKEQRVDQLFSAMDRISQSDSEVLSPESVAEELAAMRAERRTQNG